MADLYRNTLSGLVIENHTSTGYNDLHTTNIVDNVTGLSNELFLPRAVRLRIRVITGSDIIYSTEPWMEELPSYNSNGPGWLSVCTNDIGISGAIGSQETLWTSAGNPNVPGYNVGPINPLYQTEYEPSVSDNGGNNLTYLSNTPYYVPGGHTMPIPQLQFQVPGNTIRPYRLITEENVVQYGHQDLAAFINDGGAGTDLSPLSGEDDSYWMGDYGTADDTSPQGLWQHNTTGVIYTAPDQAAAARWPAIVKHVVMFDTLGINSEGKGLPGNEIDVFVVFKDQNDEVWSGQGFENIHVTIPNFPYINLLGNTGTTGDYPLGSTVNGENSNGIVNIDFDGMPQWTKGDTSSSNMPGIHGIGGVGGSRNSGTSRNIFTLSIPELPNSTVTMNSRSSFPKWRITDKKYTNEEIDSGVDTSVKRFLLEGEATVNYSKITSMIKLEAEEGYYFSKEPYITRESNKEIHLKLLKEITTNKKPTCYYYEVCFKSKKASNISNNLKATVNYVIRKFTVDKSLAILDIQCGAYSENFISSEGEEKEIRIYGVPGSSFGITVNESYGIANIGGVGSAETTPNYRVDDVGMNHADDVTILKDTIGVIGDAFGSDIRILKGVIPKNGIFSFYQKFPSSCVAKTTVKELDASKVKLNTNASAIKVNDKFHGNNEILYKGHVTGLNPDGDDSNEVSVSVSKAHSGLVVGKPIEFRRDRYYSIKPVPDLCSGGYDRVKVFKQCRPIMLQIDNSMSGSDYAITHLNGVATSLSAGSSCSVKIGGHAGKYSYNKDSINVSLLLDIVNSNHEWKTFHKPKDSLKYVYLTNSDSSTNGGTLVELKNARTSVVGLNTITFSYEINVVKWGYEDVTMVFDLDKVYDIDTT